MQFSGTQTKVAIAVIVLAVIGLGYFIWSRAAPSEPVLGRNQTIQNPLGEAPRNPQPQAAAPSGSGGMGGSAGMPAPGTSQPGIGFGPSRNARIPGSR